MKVSLVFLVAASLACAINGATVNPSLKLKLGRGLSTDVLVSLESISDVFTSQSVLGLRDANARVQKMVSMLKQRTSASQKPFVDLLLSRGKTLGTDFQPFWITNKISVSNADADLVAALTQIPGDFEIKEAPVYSLIDSTESRPATQEEIKQGLQWHLEKIETQRAWTITRGAGAVVAIIDTGVHKEHEALEDNYMGGNEAWYDPISNTTEPADYTAGHGTHALGTIIGNQNGIGIAPEAKWVACRGITSGGYAYINNTVMCGEWLLAINPRPNVVYGAWGTSYNNQDYNDVIEAWGIANIIPVFPIGQSGPRCNNPVSPADQPGVIAVGATDRDDIVANTSSRGPGPIGRQKPEISAPGVSILSSGVQGTTSYIVKSGTASAAPSIAGAIALYMSRNPTADLTQVLDALKATGDRPEVANGDLQCSVSEWPNMAFGYGRVNVGNLVGAP